MKQNEVKDTEIWTEEKMNKLSDYIVAQSKKQTRSRKIRNYILSLKYRLEDYMQKVENKISKK